MQGGLPDPGQGEAGGRCGQLQQQNIKVTYHNTCAAHDYLWKLTLNFFAEPSLVILRIQYLPLNPGSLYSINVDFLFHVAPFSNSKEM